MEAVERGWVRLSVLQAETRVVVPGLSVPALYRLPIS